MRFKLLSVFLAIQIVSFTLWTAVFSDNSNEKTLPQASNETLIDSTLQLASASITETQPGEQVAPIASPFEPEEIIQKPALEPETRVEEVVELSYVPHFSAANMSEEQGLINPIQQNQIEQALAQLPLTHAQTLDTLTLDYDPQAHRGLGGAGIILLRAVDMTTEEFIAVFIHELGHNVDYGFLSPLDSTKESNFKDGDTALYESDPSLDFYRLSWSSNAQHNIGITDLDFVSGYATTDPFEDFAETYAYYVLHNKDFKALTASSSVLADKYNFMMNVVFNGKVFDSGEEIINSASRPWDVTVLPYDLSKFMGA